jgi:uncharacterized SAM-binding protein YcdF (DUF218 family)
MHAQSRMLELLGCAVVVLFVIGAFTPIASVVATSLGVTPQIAPADAIVVLAAGRVSSHGTLSDASLRRAVHGVDLVLNGYAPLLVFSGNGPDDSRVRAALARRYGVPPQGILTFSGARTTADEAARVKTLLGERGARTILLVTDAEHMPRAASVFKHVGFTVLPAPVNEAEWDLEPHGRLSLLHRTARELAAVLYYRAAGYL